MDGESLIDDVSDCSNNDLNPKQQRALILLVGGANVTEAASELGVARSTVWRWAQNGGFARALAAAYEQRMNIARVQLEAGAMEAVEVLHGLMSDANQPGTVRVQAARELLGRAGDWAMSKASRDRHRQVVCKEIEHVLSAVRERMTAASYGQLVQALAELIPVHRHAA